MPEELMAQIWQACKTELAQYIDIPIDETASTLEESIRKTTEHICQSQADKVVSPFELDREASDPAAGLLVFKPRNNFAELN